MAGVRNFTRDNFAIYIRIDSEPVPVQVLSDQDINNLNFNQVSFTDNMEDIVASVSLTSELFGIFQENTQPELPRVIVVVYDVSSPLFQDQIDSTGTCGVILSVRQSQSNLTQLQNAVPPTDLSDMVEFEFQVRVKKKKMHATQ